MSTFDDVEEISHSENILLIFGGSDFDPHMPAFLSDIDPFPIYAGVSFTDTFPTASTMDALPVGQRFMDADDIIDNFGENIQPRNSSFIPTIDNRFNRTPAISSVEGRKETMTPLKQRLSNPTNGIDHGMKCLIWNRTRRVFGRVKGNNQEGRKGKLICLECRKIRSVVPLLWSY